MKLLQVTKTVKFKNEALEDFDNIIKHLRSKGCEKLFLCKRNTSRTGYFVAREWDKEDDEYIKYHKQVSDYRYNHYVAYKPINLKTITYEEI